MAGLRLIAGTGHFRFMVTAIEVAVVERACVSRWLKATPHRRSPAAYRVIEFLFTRSSLR
jgi:hypothetical protein